MSTPLPARSGLISDSFQNLNTRLKEVHTGQRNCLGYEYHWVWPPFSPKIRHPHCKMGWISDYCCCGDWDAGQSLTHVDHELYRNLNGLIRSTRPRYSRYWRLLVSNIMQRLSVFFPSSDPLQWCVSFRTLYIFQPKLTPQLADMGAHD